MHVLHHLEDELILRDLRHMREMEGIEDYLDEQQQEAEPAEDEEDGGRKAQTEDGQEDEEARCLQELRHVGLHFGARATASRRGPAPPSRAVIVGTKQRALR